MTSLLVRKSLLWLAGFILPATPLLRQRIAYAVQGIGYVIAGAVILASVFVACVCALYVYIVSRGVEPVVAFSCMAAFAFFIGIVLLMLAKRHLHAVSSMKDDLSLSSRARRSEDPLNDLVEQLARFPVSVAERTGTNLRDVASAFMDGLMNGRPDESRNRDNDDAPSAAKSASTFEIHAVHHENGRNELHIGRHDHQPREDSSTFL